MMLGITLGGCARKAAEPPDNTDPGAQDLETLIEEARREGELFLNWDQNTIPSYADEWLADFNETYGLEITMQLTPGSTMPANAAQLIQEYQAGRPASTDVLLGSHNHFYLVGPNGADALQAIDWTSWAPNIRDASLHTSDKVGVKLLTQTAGVAYNTELVPADRVPRRVEDLTQVEGRIAATPYGAGFTQWGSSELLGQDAVLDLVASMSIDGLLSCGDETRVASGEFAMLIGCDRATAEKVADQGGPVAFVIPEDGAFVQYWYIGVPKNARHPNVAKLWINYLLSPRAQEIMYQADFNDLHLLETSRTAEAVRAYESEGVTFLDLSYDWLVRNPEIIDEEYTAAVGEALRGE
jgi:iron(III) transport system substrate-binding protein